MIESGASRTAIIQIGPTLIATLQGSIDDRAALDLKTDLSERIVATSAQGVLLELSTIEIVDSFIGRVISDIAGVAKLLGARVVISGMQPAVAITLVELGLELTQVECAVSAEQGLDLLDG
jgi:rsbT antagonist protein RsbS